MSESRDEAAPPAKRARLQNSQDPRSNSAPGSNFSPPASGANVHGKTPSMPAGFVCEFPVRNLEDFYKPCPNYRLPMEIGSFSLDTKGKVQLDRSQLRYYTPPQIATRVMFDLRVGYDRFVPKKCNVPANKLDPILEWINGNGDCFRPRRQPLSPPNVSSLSSTASSTTTTTQPSSSQAPAALKNGGLDRSMSLEVIPPTTGASARERPDDLLTNFITWRGMLTKMLCSPYNRTEPWKMAATLHNGSIYLSEIETEESRKREEKKTPREHEMCYWGLKFEDYLTNREAPPPGKPATPTTPSARTGTVNPNQAFCTVVRTRMASHSIVMAAEIDCVDPVSKEKPPQSYIELKTNREILTDRNKSSFRRYKLMKWWAQSFLVGVPKITCGFRNDDGVVKVLQTFKTAEIPHETQVDLTMWQPSVCLNFLDELLTWIRKTVVKDDPKVVYLIEWKSPYTNVSCTECSVNNEHMFLPGWFLTKQSPPTKEDLDS